MNEGVDHVIDFKAHHPRDLEMIIYAVLGLRFVELLLEHTQAGMEMLEEWLQNLPPKARLTLLERQGASAASRESLEVAIKVGDFQCCLMIEQL